MIIGELSFTVKGNIWIIRNCKGFGLDYVVDTNIIVYAYDSSDGNHLELRLENIKPVKPVDTKGKLFFWEYLSA